MAEAFSDEEKNHQYLLVDRCRRTNTLLADNIIREFNRLSATITADRKRIEELEKERDNYLEQARLYCKNSDYYSGLLDKIAKNFGKDAFISDDGSVQDSPLRAKMPQLVGKLKKELNEIDRSFVDVADQTATIERLRGALTEIAAYGDKTAEAHFWKEGNYAAFDEPSSVQIARQALDVGKE